MTINYQTHEEDVLRMFNPGFQSFTNEKMMPSHLDSLIQNL